MSSKTEFSKMTMAQFIKNLAASPRGRIICSNILGGLDEELLTEVQAREVLKWWHAYFLHLSTASRPHSAGIDIFLKNATDALNLVLFAPENEFIRPGMKKPDFRCLVGSNGVPSPTDSADVCNVVDTHSFIFYLLSNDARRELLARRRVVIDGWPNREEVNGFALRGTQVVELKSNSTLGKPEGLLWLVPAEDIQADIRASDAADRLRDVLGLVHYEKGEALVVLALSADVFGKDVVVRPTFADAGGHPRFRAWADLPSDRSWGCTVDLALLADRSSVLDGRRERIAKSITTNIKITAKATPLGNTLLTRGQNGDGDDEFAHRLENRYSKESVLQRLNELVEAE